MKNESSSSNGALIVVIVIFVGLFLWFLVAYANSKSNYSTAVSENQIKESLVSHGLHVCDTKSLSLSSVPGLESAKSLSVSTDCNNNEVTPMSIAVMKFSDEASRNTAMQRAQSSSRSGASGALVYGYGPYVLAVQGPRTIALQALFDQAIGEASMN